MMIKAQIEAIMREQRPGPRSTAAVLKAVSVAYDAAIRLRNHAYTRGVLRTRRLSRPVISVGNLTLGGTGKTPMVGYLARFIRHHGLKAVIISRGYKGAAEQSGGVVSDGRKLFMSADMSGDEPFMLAGQLRHVPVVVGRDRCRVGATAVERFRPDVLVLDDGFQHRQLQRDIDLVLLDAERPFGNGHLFPRGALRESPTAIRRGSAVILTRSTPATAASSVRRIASITKNLPVFPSTHAPYVRGIVPAGRKVLSGSAAEKDLRELRGARVFAFSGIARNDDFQNSLAGGGLCLAGFLSFSDHHRYTNVDLKRVLRLARQAGAQVIATTEKDHARIGGSMTWPLDLFVIGVRMTFDGDAFEHFLKTRLKRLGLLPQNSNAGSFRGSFSAE